MSIAARVRTWLEDDEAAKIRSDACYAIELREWRRAQQENMQRDAVRHSRGIDQIRRLRGQ